MSKTITNLAIPIIVEEIENVLDSHHYYPYRQAYATPELRQKLITRVLNSVPALYAMVEAGEAEETIDLNLVPRSLRKRLRAAVIEGVETVIEENSDWISHHIPQEAAASYAPSSWFG